MTLNEIIMSIMAFITGGSLLTVVTLKAKRDEAKAKTDKIEMDNFKTGTDLLMSQIVNPLKEEIKNLRGQVKCLTKAINKISVCPNGENCPVKNELNKND